MSIPFKTSKTTLIFEKGLSSTQTFDLTWDESKYCNVFMDHYLPDSFTVEPGNDNLIKKPCQISVTYRPCSGSREPIKNSNIIINAYLRRSCKPTRITALVQIVEKSRSPTMPKRIYKASKNKSLEVKKPLEKSEFFDCQVCFEPFSASKEKQSPRILSICGHTLCLKCVETLHEMSEDQCSVTCPFDRKMTFGPIDTFPKNYVLDDLLRERNQQTGMKKITPMVESVTICEDPDFPCFENKKHESTKYCETCKVDFCHFCFKSSHSPKVIAGHKAIPIEEKPLQLPKCPIHPGNFATKLCKNKLCSDIHRLCCDSCLSQTHKQHKIASVKEIMKENERILRDINEKVESRITEFSEKLWMATRYDIIVKLEKELGLMNGMKKKIEKTLRRRETLFVEELIAEGEDMWFEN